MRRLAVVSLIGLLLAAPAAAQDRGRIAPDAAGPSIALRGPVGGSSGSGAGEQAAPDALASLIPVPPPVAPPGAPVAGDSRQCKRSCNRDYYFCLSAEEETCAPTWAKCTARCG